MPKNVSRFKDRKGLTGFQVRVQWKNIIRFGRVYDHLETDPLMAAVELRDEFEFNLGKPRTERRITSAGTGVSRSIDGNGNASYRASCFHLRANFSTKRFGEKGAEQMAIHAREAMLEQILSKTRSNE